MLQELKCVNPYYQDVIEDRKRFEVRWNDRFYHAGDILLLREYDKEKDCYSGREVYVVVDYMLTEFEGLVKGYVVLGISKFDYLRVSERER